MVVFGFTFDPVLILAPTTEDGSPGMLQSVAARFTGNNINTATKLQLQLVTRSKYHFQDVTAATSRKVDQQGTGKVCAGTCTPHSAGIV